MAAGDRNRRRAGARGSTAGATIQPSFGSVATAVRDQVVAPADGHPAACPWCGRDHIRGIVPSPDGNRWYRCVACSTTFFITTRQADRDAPAIPHQKAGSGTR
jgi:hypothetical protein